LNPDDLRRWAEQDRTLIEVAVLGHNRETMRCREFPDGDVVIRR
jgi:hypothetical protein